MGFREWLVTKLGGVTRSEVDELKHSFKAHGSFVELIQSYLGAGDREDDVEMTRAYERNPVVYRCVSAIARACSQVSLKFYRLNRDGEREEVKDHLAAQIYQFVNEEMSTADLEEATHGWLALRGEAYWLLERAGSRIASLRVLNPERVRVIAASSAEFQRTGQRISKYEYQVEGRAPMTLMNDEVVSFFEWSPYRDLRGLDPLGVASETLKIDRRLRRHGWKFLDNFADPGAFIESEKEISNEYYKRFVRQVKQQHRGVNNAGEIVMIDDGMKWVFNDGRRELGYMDGRKMTRAELLMLWGVPPLIAGVGDDAKYDSADAQERAFWLLTIAPRLAKHAMDLTEKFLPMFPNTQGMMCEYDLSSIPAFQSIEMERAERVEKLSSTLTINERRALLGKKPLPGGDVILQPLSLVPVAGEVGDGQRQEMTTGERQEATTEKRRLRRI